MKIKKIATLILSSLLSLGAMAQKKQVITETVNGVSFNMVYVKGGTFNMGAQNEKSYEDNYDPDATSNESPVHSVTLSNYYIGETEVTQELWEAVMGTTGYYVYRKTANSGWIRIAAVGGTNNTTYLDKTAQKGVTYTYTVRAVYGATTSYFNSGISCYDKY